jgi:ring-1,2-phenylacetyl-CoA epoxidase subunit PaaC
MTEHPGEGIVTTGTTVLALADDALIAAQRLAEWCSRGPELEEDIALANIALDQLGTARLLLTKAGEPVGRTEDDLAYLRTDREFRNCLLVELPNGDFAVTMAKLLFLAAYQKPLYERLAGDDEIGPIAAKAVKESAYHLDHARLWMVRLGDGTEESHRRAQRAVDDLWPYTHELFEPPFEPLREPWLETVQDVLKEATLERPEDRWRPTGGRTGVHTEHLSLLLAEMQVLHRAHRGATW